MLFYKVKRDKTFLVLRSALLIMQHMKALKKS